MILHKKYEREIPTYLPKYIQNLNLTYVRIKKCKRSKTVHTFTYIGTVIIIIKSFIEIIPFYTLFGF